MPDSFRNPLKSLEWKVALALTSIPIRAPLLILHDDVNLLLIFVTIVMKCVKISPINPIMTNFRLITILESTACWLGATLTR